MPGNGASRVRANPARRAAGAGSAGRRRRPARVDLAHYVPTIVSSFADRLRASSVAFLRDHFGISRLEWRVLSFLVARGGAPSAYLIWNAINADKGALSRTLQSLSDKGLVRVREMAGARRRTRVELTAQGRRLQAATVGIILERQRCLLEGVSPAEVDALLAVIRRLEANIPKMDGVVERMAPGRGRAALTPRSTVREP